MKQPAAKQVSRAKRAATPSSVGALEEPLARLDAKQTTQQLTRLSTHLSAAQYERLRVIAALLSAETREVAINRVFTTLFGPEQTQPKRKTVQFGETAIAAANKALSRLVSAVESAADEAQINFALRITGARAAGYEKRAAYFEGTATVAITHETLALDELQPRLVENPRGMPVHQPKPLLQLSERRDDKWLVQCYLSYAPADRALALQLKTLLQEQLNTQRNYAVQLRDNSELLPGDDREAQSAEMRQLSHCLIPLVSHAYLGVDSPLSAEIPPFEPATGPTIAQRVFPVALTTVDTRHTDMKQLSGRAVFGADKAFDQALKRKRAEWVTELIGQLRAMLDRETECALPESLPDDQQAVLLKQRGGLGGSRHRTDDLARLPEFVPLRAHQASLNAKLLDERTTAASEGVFVMDYLLDWVRNRSAPALFALLGEYGMGKTIACQRLVRDLEHLRADDPSLPEPLYFDLRKLTGLRTRGSVPTLPEILDECVQRGWGLESGTLPTAQALLELAERRAVLFVFDGLDEALVHLSDVDGQVFTRELLRVADRSRTVPRSAARTPRGGPTEGSAEPETRVLISCRTHFFRTLADQQAHFCSQDRDGVSAVHFTALQLLPFEEQQIRAYLQHALPTLNTDTTLELIRSTHNLTDLASRPYTLQLVGEFIPELERLRASGQTVYGITLYAKFVEQWLQRDGGKHHLQPTHKLRLMRDLAAHLWRKGQRSIDAEALETWLHAWLEASPELRRRYQNVTADQLEEDLRTATFLVREDGDNPGFRFAHSSLQEYFLAGYLFEAVVHNRRSDWALPLVSTETLGFLAEYLAAAQDAKHAQTLGSWRAPYLRLASEQWLNYALQAARSPAAHRWPTFSLVGADLSGAKLDGWRFQGASEQAPLNMTDVLLQGCSLRETRWQAVRLNGARFNSADLTCAELQRVSGTPIDLRNVDATGATFRQCALADANWGGAQTYRTRFLFTDAPALVGAQHAPGERKHPSPSQTPRVIADCGPDGGVGCAFSPDGAHVLSASRDNTLKLWDARSGDCLLTLSGHTNTVLGCAFSPDGTCILSASGDGSLKLWDTRSGDCLLTLSGHTNTVLGCAFSPDGAHVLSASYDSTLKLWDARSGDCLLTLSGHASSLFGCAFSPDGACILSASDDRTLKLWDARSGDCLLTLPGHTNTVLGCAFSPDGAYVLSASSDNTLKLWDARSGDCLLTLSGHTSGVVDCAFSPDGAHILSASYDSTLKLWCARSGDCLLTLSEHADSVRGCAFSPDGAHIFSVSHDDTFKFWDTRSGDCLRTLTGHTNSVRGCALSPDGAYALSASDDRALRLWDARSGDCLRTLTGHASGVLGCTFSPDGKYILSASVDRTLKLWDAQSGDCLLTLTEHTKSVRGCTFSPDGAYLLSASFDGTLKLWDARSGDCLLTLSRHSNNISDCAFSPDSVHILSASFDRTLKLWDARSGDCLITLSGHAGRVLGCAFSPDGTHILSASNDKTLKLWDARSGDCLITLSGHTDSVIGCAFSPDGAHILSASLDNTLRLWDARSGDCLITLAGHTGSVRACAFSPDGAHILSGGDKGELLVWESATGALLRRHVLLPLNEHCVWNESDQAVTEATAGAWRWMRYQLFDDAGKLIDVVPIETFGELPPPRRLAAPNDTHQ